MPVIAPGSLVLLIGPAGAGKTTFCQQLIADGLLPVNAVISPDLLRAQAFDSIEEQREKDRLERLTLELVELRLQYGKTVVLDDRNLLPDRRKAFRLLAERWQRPTVVVVFDTPLDELLRRDRIRGSRQVGERLLGRQIRQQESHSLPRQLAKEFDQVVRADEPIEFEPYPKPVWRLDISGPVAVIGDIHGSAARLEQLLNRLDTEWPGIPLFSVGDLGDRGEDTPTVYDIVADRGIRSVASNHGQALVEKTSSLLDHGHDIRDIARDLASQAGRLTGSRQNPATGTSAAETAETVAQFARRRRGGKLLARAVDRERQAPHQLFIDGQLLVVHGGVTPELVGSESEQARKVALYGTPTGQDPETGMPVERDSWREAYDTFRGSLPTVVYGHIAYDTPQQTARTVGIDTGAGKSPDGLLTAAIFEQGSLVTLLST